MAPIINLKKLSLIIIKFCRFKTSRIAEKASSTSPTMLFYKKLSGCSKFMMGLGWQRPVVNIWWRFIYSFNKLQGDYYVKPKRPFQQ
ncbi:MAG: hypothetical protein ACXV9T_10875, partial [Methylobacter sp.]